MARRAVVAAALVAAGEEGAQDVHRHVLAESAGAPRASTLASLWARDRRAVSGSAASTQRMPGWRLAAIDMPTPLPQTSTPKRAWPASTARQTAWAKSG